MPSTLVRLRLLARARFGVALALLLLAPVLSRAADPATDGDTVQLSPFTVSSTEDSGYGAKQTVSATRTATNLADLPLSINVMTDQFMLDLAAVDIQSALAYENISSPATDAFTSNISTSYNIRGFTAATMRNGFLSAGGSTPVSRMAVDRIEIVKGPSSLLYGEMDPGGLVNVVSKRPSATRATTLTGNVGTYDNFGGTFDTTGAITRDGRFTYRFMGMENKGGDIYNGTYTQRRELVGMIGAKLSADSDLNLEYDFVHHHVDQPGGEAYLVNLGTDAAGRGLVRQWLLPGDGAPPASFNYRGPGDYGDGLERYFNAELRQRWVGNWNTRLAFSNIWDNTGSITRNGGTLIPTPSATFTDTYKHGTNTTQGLQGDATNTWNIRGVEWKFLAGVSASRGSSMFLSGTSPQTLTKINILNPATFPQPWPPPAPPLSTFTKPTANSHGTFEDSAIYTTNTVALFQKRLHLLGGARAQKVKATAYNYLSKTVGHFALNGTSYQGGALYQLTRDVGVYASWSESFNPQNVLLRDPKPIDPATGLPKVDAFNDTRAADPIKGQGHDIGFKTSLFGGRVDFTGAYYTVRRSNEIQTRTIVDDSGNTLDIYDVQSGTEWSQGVDFSLTGSPVRNVDVIVNYNQPFSGILLSDVSNPKYQGKQLQNNPKQQLSAFTKYTFATGRLSGLSIGLGGRYWGHSQAFLPTQPQIATLPPYFLMDAVASYRWRLGRMHYIAQLNVTNLLNRHVLISGYSYSGDTTYRFTLTAKF
ncbi:MAG TPA: TonB-dependent receptor [Opitutaceae bacterium]|nr:TonB-dependent receptor [Opitutaceae bacterium]